MHYGLFRLDFCHGFYPIVREGLARPTYPHHSLKVRGGIRASAVLLPLFFCEKRRRVPNLILIHTPPEQFRRDIPVYAANSQGGRRGVAGSLFPRIGAGVGGMLCFSASFSCCALFFARGVAVGRAGSCRDGSELKFGSFLSARSDVRQTKHQTNVSTDLFPPRPGARADRRTHMNTQPLLGLGAVSG